ncbi:MAG: HlyD family type I secretion periplasmic adaptor subunit [Halioglobus sp.]
MLWVLWRRRAILGDNRLSAEQRRFLPAALEVQDTPPSPAGRWLQWSLLSLFSLVVLWACFGSVDIVVTAPGRIVPSGQVKTVQAFETGMVSGIHVEDGERVELGQKLVSLDPTVAAADEQRISLQIHHLSQELRWRRALDAWLAGGEAMQKPAPANVVQSSGISGTSRLYDQHVAQVSAQFESIERERDATRAELAMAQAESDRVAASLPILKDRLAAYKALYEAQFGAKVAYLEILQQYTAMQKSVPVLEAREQQLLDTLAVLTARISVARQEHRTQNLLHIARIEAEKTSLIEEGKKASQHYLQQVLTAPVTGTVQQISIHTIGGVVTPAQELMKIVPEHASIEVEAFLLNRDIGFVKEGQPVEIKIDAFNFTKYGLVEAQLLDISNDAVEHQHLGWVYKLQLQLFKDSIDIDEKAVKLSPGMAVTAEIKTGTRRLIEFFLSPLLRYRQESVRER